MPEPLTLKPDEVVYDGEFVVRESRFGLLNSIGIKDSKGYVTGPLNSLDAVIFFTREHIKRDQGIAQDHLLLEKSYDGTVGGKL